MTYRLYRLTTETRRCVCWLGWAGDPIVVGDVIVRDDDPTPWTVRTIGPRELSVPGSGAVYDVVSVN